MNASDSTVSWSIGEGSAGGTITDTGVYTAPATEGQYHVIATSKADSAKSASAIVTVRASLFSPTGNLLVGRFSGHTATLLPSGQVFVAGGMAYGPSGNYELVDDAEEFDPATGTFQSAGKIARSSYSATLLANGDVLIAGGLVQLSPKEVPTDSVEILKAGSGVLQQTNNLSAPRFGHTATLLQDGRVLIAGGYVLTSAGVIQETTTAELYDPAIGTFAPTGNMSMPHIFHTATPLPNGKVLIAGGSTSAELYDPATNTFRLTGSTAAARLLATMTTLPDGTVLITGGEVSYEEIYEGPAEIYDPATGQFTLVGKMLTPRFEHTATLLPDGTVLIAGGAVDADNSTPTVGTEIFHPESGSFTAGPSMKIARAGHTATLLRDGSVLVAGGDKTGNTAEIYH